MEELTIFTTTNKNMRTIKELLQLMLDNQHLFENGLCQWNTNLFSLYTSADEYYLVISYILENKPITLYRMFINNGYFWRPGDIKPRIKWLKKHISIN